ncbi:stage II sporulation protein D [Clostridium polynesiense]|uniref:stage II sporulation protein D n=1 Tax=Clostridium polynesiense TaxID=1325933 RepID=UPI000693E622|nr:stage II sporulation protein D [Clostridium polynesiense]
MYRKVLDKNQNKFFWVKIISISVVFMVLFLLIFKLWKTIEYKQIKQDYEVKKFILQDERNHGFNGNIKVYISEENKTVELNIEDYVMGVLSGEMPITFELEALKAQAVAARTYALAKMLNNCSASKGAHICDTVHCQVYKSKDKRMASWPSNKKEEYWNKLSKAVMETEGQILTYNGEVVLNAQYFSTSWGKTENSQAVFAKEIPYLKSVVSEGEEISNRYKSSAKISLSDFTKAVNAKYPQCKLSTYKLKTQVKIISRNEGGSVKDLKLGEISISGKDFRSLFNLNSANFNIVIDKNNIEINCLGYGHGVGMSQWGANVMAGKGKSYLEILTHYYTGVNVEKITINKEN